MAGAAAEPGTGDLYLMLVTYVSLASYVGFPITGNAYMPERRPVRGEGTYGNLGTLYLCRLSADGTTVVGGTYLDGSRIEGGLNYGGVWETPHLPTVGTTAGALAVDTDGKVVGVSSTRSSDFPVTIPSSRPLSPYGLEDRGHISYNTVVFKMNEDMSDMEWGIYLGGEDLDVGLNLAISEDFFYVTGATRSHQFTPFEQYTGGDNTANADESPLDVFVVAISKEDVAQNAFNQGMNIRFLGAFKRMFPTLWCWAQRAMCTRWAGPAANTLWKTPTDASTSRAEGSSCTNCP